MLGKEYTFQQKINELREREKELKCLYRVEEVIQSNPEVDTFFFEIIKRIPTGWQYPEICKAKISFEGSEFKEPGWIETEWSQKADLIVDETVSGKIEIFYTDYRKLIIDSQFLPQEQKLLNTIASRISNYIFNKRLANSIDVLQETIDKHEKESAAILAGHPDSHWVWRKQMAELMAERLDFERFGIKGVYLIGSTKNANAGPASDIDLLVHVSDGNKDHAEFKAWIEGWSMCLSEINYTRTGYKTDGLIDLHLITDEDILKKTSYAVMIGNHTDGASPIKLKEQ